MLRKRTGILLLLSLFLLVACGGASVLPADRAGMAEAPMEDTGGDEGFSAADQDLAQVDLQEQLIIRTGELAIVVEDTEESIAAITALAEGQGGWVVNSNLYRRSDDAFSAAITIRVPVARFADAMAAIQDLALEVEQAAQESQDVTEEYVDLTARLENLEATAERVRGFLEEADDVEEALAVNQELSRLEGEIEALKGRIQYLEQSASFSTITVNLTPDALSQPIEVGGWRPTGVAKEALETLIDGLQLLGTLAIWGVIVILPLALLILLPLLLIGLVIRRRRRARDMVAEEE
jgi:hypothetical protein